MKDKETNNNNLIRIIKIKIALINVFMPLFFIITGQVFNQLYNPYRPFSDSLIKRIITGLNPGIIIIFCILASFTIFIILTLLKPLFTYISQKKMYRKARKATLRIPWILIIIHVSAWALASVIFYSAYNWMPPNGMPFLWALIFTTSSGLIGGVFTAFFMSNLLIKPKTMLLMTGIEDNENDYFIKYKEFIIFMTIIYYLGVNISYIGNFFAIKGIECGYSLPFYPSLFAWFIFFSLLLFGIVFLSRREFYYQVKLVQNKLKELSTGKGDLSKRITLLNFDEIGQMSSKINRFLKLLGDIIKIVKEESGKTSNLSTSLQKIVKENEEFYNDFYTFMQNMLLSVENEQSEVDAAREDMIIMVDTISQFLKNIMEQVAAIEITTSTLNSMIDAFSHITETAFATNELSKNIQNRTTRSADELNILYSNMLALEKSAGNVIQIIGVITDIAELTNILAINASIEAAHAGYTGKGFAVVAHEIRKLSEKTTSSLKLINNHIDEMSDNTKNGMNAVTNLKASLDAMFPQIKTSISQVSTIAADMENEMKHAQEIKGAINTITNLSSQMQGLSGKQKAKSERIKEVMDILKSVTKKTEELTASIGYKLSQIRKNKYNLEFPVYRIAQAAKLGIIASSEEKEVIAREVKEIYRYVGYEACMSEYPRGVGIPTFVKAARRIFLNINDRKL